MMTWGGGGQAGKDQERSEGRWTVIPDQGDHERKGGPTAWPGQQGAPTRAEVPLGTRSLGEGGLISQGFNTFQGQGLGRDRLFLSLTHSPILSNIRSHSCLG